MNDRRPIPAAPVNESECARMGDRFDGTIRSRKWEMLARYLTAATGRPWTKAEAKGFGAWRTARMDEPAPSPGAPRMPAPEVTSDDLGPEGMHPTDDPDQKYVVTHGIPESLDALMDMFAVDRNEWEASRVRINAWGQDSNPNRQCRADLQRKAGHWARRVPAAQSVPRLPAPRPSGRPEVALIVPDIQLGYDWTRQRDGLIPYHDRRVLDLALQVAERVRPSEVVFLGDDVDLAGLSTKFLRDPRVLATVQPALDELHWWFAQMRQAARSARIRKWEGNHGARLRKFLCEKAPEVVDLCRVGESKPALSLEYLLALDEIDVEMVGPYPAVGDLWGWCVGHGDTHRSKPGGSVGAVVSKAMQPHIFGHVHSREAATRTEHLADGSIHVIEARSPGVACHIDGRVPGVSPRPSWQQGLDLLYHWPETGATYATGLPIDYLTGTLVLNGELLQARDRMDELVAGALGPDGPWEAFRHEWSTPRPLAMVA